MAQQATTAEALRRQQAELARERAEEEADEAQQQVLRANARDVLAGLTVVIDNASVTGVKPRLNANATLTTTPGFTLGNPAGSRHGSWYRTSFSARDVSYSDRLDVYSNVESLPNIPFKDSQYNTNGVLNADDDVVGGYPIPSTVQTETTASSFPTRSTTQSPSNCGIGAYTPRLNGTTIIPTTSPRIIPDRIATRTGTPLNSLRNSVGGCKGQAVRINALPPP